MRIAILLLACLAGAVAAEAQGTIQGRVFDTSGNGLPGVEIQVTAAGYSAKAVTNAEGAYRVTNLAAGRYAVRATLAGFCPAQREVVAVTTDQATEANFTLVIAAPRGPDWAETDTRYLWSHADVAVYLRIGEAMETKNWPAPTCGSIACRPYRATVLAAVGARAGGTLAPGDFTFLQDYVGEGEPAYAKGSEYVAFLTWNQSWSVYVRTGGPSSLLPVRDGRVVTRASQDREYEGLKVEDFLAQLRTLASAPRFQTVQKVEGHEPPHAIIDVVTTSGKPVPLADVWSRADAIVHLRITRTLPWKPQPQPAGGRPICTEHEAAIVEVLKSHPVEGPTGARFGVLQESAGDGGLAAYAEGTELVAFLTWRPMSKRFALWRDSLAVRDGRVVRLRDGRVVREDASDEPLFTDVPRGTGIENLLAGLRALRRGQR